LYFSRIFSELSVDPSFTKISSISLKVCLSKDSIHRSKYFSILKTGIIILIFGLNKFLLLIRNFHTNCLKDKLQISFKIIFTFIYFIRILKVNMLKYMMCLSILNRR